eukprot:135012-Chlamydomonas_euryale.AAC.1
MSCYVLRPPVRCATHALQAPPELMAPQQRGRHADSQPGPVVITYLLVVHTNRALLYLSQNIPVPAEHT